MKKCLLALPMIALAVSLIWVVALARALGSREAREKIAAALSLDRPDRVRIKSIAPGMGGGAIVEAQIETAVRFIQDKQGNWQAVDMRAGDGRWESIELIETAVRKEKALRTAADLRTIATALEAFRRERGFYVEANDGAALIDNLSPQYLSAVLRLDAWSREFEYKGKAAGYRLASLGADGLARTGDDIIIENGKFTQGASRVTANSTDAERSISMRVAAAHRSAQVIVIAFAASIVVYMFIGFLLAPRISQVDSQVPIPFYVAAVFLAFGSITLRRTQLRPMRLEVVAGLRGTDGLLKHLVNITIISAALAEMIGVLAVVVAFSGGTIWDVVRLGVVALVITLYSYPRRAAWQKTIDYFAATVPGAASS